MTAFGVDPPLLVEAAMATKIAAQRLGSVPRVAAVAQESASAMHYQPAAGMAEAVAQKSASRVELVTSVLGVMVQGLRVASGNYQDADENAGGGMGDRPDSHGGTPKPGQ